MKKNSNHKKGIDYERKAADLFELLKDPGTDVQYNVRIKGKITNNKRQIDLQIVEGVDKDFLIIDCKNLKKKVGSRRVETLLGGLENLGTSRCGIVSNSGYTNGALAYGRSKGVELFSLVDTDDNEISQLLNFKVLRVDFKFSSADVRLVPPKSAVIRNYPDGLTLINSMSGQTISTLQLAKVIWNSGNLPLKLNSNTPISLEIKAPQLKVLDDNNNQHEIISLNCKFTYTLNFYERLIPIIQARGIYNVREKSFKANELVTDNFDLVSEDGEWEKLTNTPEFPYYPIQTAVIIPWCNEDGTISSEYKKGMLTADKKIKLAINSRDGHFSFNNINS